MDFVKIERAGVVKSVSKYSWDIGQKSLIQQGWQAMGSYSSDKPESVNPSQKSKVSEPVSSFVPPEVLEMKSKITDPNLVPETVAQTKSEPVKTDLPKSKGGRPKKS